MTLLEAARPPLLIAITGADGCGKSTAVAKLAFELRRAGRSVEVLDRWDILDGESHPSCRFITAPLASLRRCVADMDGISRALFLFWTFATVYASRTRECEFVLTDGYWMKHAAAEIVYGAPPAWIEAMASTLPRPFAIYLLDLEPEEAFARKPSLVPYECGMATPSRSTFIEHQSRLRAILSSWARAGSWRTVSATLPPGAIAERLCLELLESSRTMLGDGAES